MASRSDERWKAPYARGQDTTEHGSAADSILNAPFLSSLVATDGATYMLRVVPPGEHYNRVGLHALVSVVGGFLTKGAWMHESDNPCWVVLIERQRGPWRGFERVEEHTFARATEAAQCLAAVRKRLTTVDNP